MRVPTTSAGTRSGVNWIRANDPPVTLAMVSTASVLATPGTPSSRQWPRARSATNIRSIILSWPTITRLTSNIARSRMVASWAGVLTEGGAAIAGGTTGGAGGEAGAPETGAGVVGSVTGVLQRVIASRTHQASHDRPTGDAQTRYFPADYQVAAGSAVLT